MTRTTEDTERLLAETGWLRDLARCLVAGKDLADDVAQETLLRAWRRGTGSVQNLRGWLAAVARSVALRFARTAQRQRRQLQELPPQDHEVSAAEVCERTQRQRDVMDAALRLAEPNRSAVLLRFQGGLGYREIAQQLGVPIETVRTRIKRGLAHLREELDSRHGGTQAWALPVLGLGWQGSGAAVAAGVTVMAIGKVAAVLAASAAVWIALPSDEVGPPGGNEVRVKVEAATSLASGGLSRDSTGAATGSAQRIAADLPGPRIVPDRNQNVPVPETWEVVGRIVDAQTAQPIHGAMVSFGRIPIEVRDSRDELGSRKPLVMYDFGGGGELRTPSDGAVSRATTDGDGSFRLTEVVASHPAELVAECADYAPNRSQLGPWFELVASRDPRQHVIDIGDLALHRGVCIAGRVVAADGVSPVPHAQITLARSIETLLNYEWLGVAGADGHFAFPHRFAADSTITSIVANAKLGAGWTVLAPTGSGDDVVIVLRPSANLRCTVVDDLERPIEDARVIVQATFAPFVEKVRIVGLGELGPRLSSFARTEPDGLAVLPSITLGDADGPSGERKLRVTAADHRCEERTIVLQPGDNEVRVVLARGSRATVRGTVVSGSDGQPVVGARVGIDQPGTRTTNAAGVFEIPAVDLTDRLLRVAVEADGFVPAFRTEPPAGRTGDLELRIVLQPGAPVRGVVRDQLGSPVAGARIEHRTDNRLVAYSDAEGRFALRAAPLGDVPLRIVPPFADLVFDGPLDVDVAGAEREAVTATLRRRR